MKIIIPLVSVILVLLSLSSCKTSKMSIKELNYLQDINDSTKNLINTVEPIIEPGDILGINITSTDPKTDLLLNGNMMSQQGVEAVPLNQTNQINGFLVENDGTISLNRIGKLKVGGLRKQEAIRLISNSLKGITNDAVVTIRFLNFKITVLGEVNRQGAYTIPTEKVTILEAIGLAGDLTVFGNRRNILVIRDINGIKHFGRINLNKGDIFSSEYYNLKQNDVVYVEMTEHKVKSIDQSTIRNLTLGLSALSTLAIILNVILR